MTTLAPGWELIPGPVVGVRTGLPAPLSVSLAANPSANPAANVAADPAADLASVAADVSAGLADHFTDVLLVDAGRDARGIELTHATGEGAVVVTRLDRSAVVRCWVLPVRDYATKRPTLRGLIDGRRVAPPRVPPPSERVPVTEAFLATRTREYAIRRRGPYAQVAEVGGPPAVSLPVERLAAWLFRAASLGSPPAAPSTAPGLVVVAESERPPLSWTLDWCTGTDEAQEPSDEDWSTAVPVGHGRIELVDSPLRRVVRDLPDALGADAREALPGAVPVALVPISRAEVFALLCSL